MERHRVYQSLNLRLMVGPADRSVFFGALGMAVFIGVVFESFAGAMIAFAALYVLAVAVGRKDPQLVYLWVAAFLRKKWFLDPSL